MATVVRNKKLVKRDAFVTLLIFAVIAASDEALTDFFSRVWIVEQSFELCRLLNLFKRGNPLLYDARSGSIVIVLLEIWRTFDLDISSVNVNDSSLS